MSETLSKDSKARSGRVRVDDRPKHLATRLERGEIAVINVADLDRDSAAALVEAAPAAVLNAQPSLTGRVAALGPRLILDGGVIATGRFVSEDDLNVEVADSSVLFAGFEGSIEDYLTQDGSTVLRGAGVPSIDRLGNRPILLVTAASDAVADLKALARWRSEAAPFVIAVDAGADVALKARLGLDLVVGDADLMSEKAIRRARAFVVRVGGDGLAPGAQRLDRMGVVYEQVAMAGTSLDAALVVAAHSGTTAVVTAGVSYGEAELVDAGRALVAPAFFSRLAVGSRLIGARAVAATFRPRPRGWALVLLALVAIALMGVALWSTPWGNDLLYPITSLFTSLTHLAGGTQ